jgi:hypothetical protein
VAADIAADRIAAMKDIAADIEIGSFALVDSQTELDYIAVAAFVGSQRPVDSGNPAASDNYQLDNRPDPDIVAASAYLFLASWEPYRDLNYLKNLGELAQKTASYIRKDSRYQHKNSGLAQKQEPRAIQF